MERELKAGHLAWENNSAVTRGLVDILLRTDGSTTRMLEAIVGSDLTLKIHHQGIAAKESLPNEIVRHFDSKGPFLRRVISLCCQGGVLSDNHVLACSESINPELLAGLIKGQIPLGKLISDIDTRRVIIQADYENADQLHHYIYPINLKSSIYPVKKYLILHENKCWFHICEVFHVHTILKYFYSAERKSPIYDDKHV